MNVIQEAKTEGKREIAIKMLKDNMDITLTRINRKRVLDRINRMNRIVKKSNPSWTYCNSDCSQT